MNQFELAISLILLVDLKPGPSIFWNASACFILQLNLNSIQSEISIAVVDGNNMD